MIYGAAPGVVFGLLVTPVMISVGQILFKIAGVRAADRGHDLIRVMIDPYLLAALAIYGAGTLIWIHVLRTLPLSAAYPFMAMSFVLVPLFSTMIFGETITLRYWLGAAMIVGGMAVLST